MTDAQFPTEGKSTRTDWTLPAGRINQWQQESLEELVKRCKQAHFTDVQVRINGQWETYQADWIKHLVAGLPHEPGGWQSIETAEPNVYVLIELAGCNIPSVGYMLDDGLCLIHGEAFSTAHRWHPLPKLTPEAKLAAPEPPEWRCTHCERMNSGRMEYCTHCEYSRKMLRDGVAHDRDCKVFWASPCSCSAPTKGVKP